MVESEKKKAFNLGKKVITKCIIKWWRKIID